MVVVPIDDQLNLVFVLDLVPGNDRTSRQLVEGSMETFHNVNAAVLANHAESVSNFALVTPNIGKMVAIELWPPVP